MHGQAEAEFTPGSIRDIRAFMIEHNRRQSEEFLNANLERTRYLALHPTEISVFKCMDGRLNMSVMTGTPVGILEPFRNIGGRFDLGWPYLQSLVQRRVFSAARRGTGYLPMVAYHFAKGELHRGCAGFKYDTDAAQGASQKLVDQFNYMYGKPSVHPVLVGMETDEGGLVFHGDAGEVFSVADNLDMSEGQLHTEFAKLYPQMRDQMRVDLLELVKGNQQYVRESRKTHRTPISLNHQEQAIVPARGVDWLHYPNLALIIGPYDPELKKAVAVAGSIVLGNIREGRVEQDAGRMLMVAKLAEEEYDRQGWRGAELSARHITEEAYGALKDAVPDLLDDNFTVMTAVIDPRTRLMHVLD